MSVTYVLDPEYVWNLYQELGSLKKVGKFLEMSETPVAACLHKAGYKLKKDPPLSLEILQNIAESYGGKVLSDKFSSWSGKIKLQCSEGHIWETQAGHIKNGTWCKQCHSLNNRIRKVDLDFFSRDTEESFYWAGFIAADGNVQIKKDKKGNIQGYELRIKLSIKDLKHLEKFKEQIQSEAQICKLWSPEKVILNNKKPTPPKEQCYITICSKKIVLDLERFGIIPAKTYHAYVPDWVQQHKYYRHFIRGFIDGDGCFTIPRDISKVKYPKVRFTMPGTAVILNNFKNEFEKQGILTRDHLPITPKWGKKAPTFDILKFGTNYIISKLYDYLYVDAVVFLERKERVAAKSKEWLDSTKTYRLYNIHTSGEELLALAQKYKSIKKISEILKCSQSYVWKLTRKYSIYAQIKKLVKHVYKVNPEKLINNTGKYNSIPKVLNHK